MLLLEAGPDYRSADTPAEVSQANSLVLQDPSRFGAYWWDTPARYTDQQEPTPFGRGKVVGGCSTVNCQVAIRGVAEDYDEWASEGCDGWSADEVLSSFVRLEHDLDFPDASYHGDSGPVAISRPGRAGFGPVDTLLADAAVDLGYGWADDHNAPGATGASPAAMNARDGRRISSSDAYLEPVRDSGYLSVLGGATAEQIVFEGRRATGVRCRTSEGQQIFEGREIFVCAGTVYSPTLLLRSGIGPSQQLAAHGVEVVVDLPAVGENLSDHAAVFMSLGLRQPAGLEVSERYPVGCLVRFTSGIGGAGRSDMGFGSFNLWPHGPEGCSAGLIFVTLFQAFSRGRITLSGSDPAREPDVRFCLLSDDRDRSRMRDGIRRLSELAAHPLVAEASASAELSGVAAGADLFSIPSPDLDAWLALHVGTIGHPSGTCRMGAADDPRSVVDSSCRVIGVDGLRVVDASVMPAAPRANNHLSCVMLAEHVVAHKL